MGFSRYKLGFGAVFAAILLTNCAGTSASNSNFQMRPGWKALSILAEDDCKTSKSGGKSLISWEGKSCSAKNIIQEVNRNPEQIPEFYALYRQYGEPSVLAINVRDGSKMNYLNYLFSVAKSLNRQTINSIYADYLNDRSSMGLARVEKSNFIKSLEIFSNKKYEYEARLNQEAKRIYDESLKSSVEGEKLGIDYKAQCGPFSIDLTSSDGWARINGVKAQSQKITPLPGNVNGNNIKMQWMVPRNDYPGWLGMDYVKRNSKAILNVEAVRSNMDQPRLFGTYDCVRVK